MSSYCLLVVFLFLSFVAPLPQKNKVVLGRKREICAPNARSIPLSLRSRSHSLTHSPSADRLRVCCPFLLNRCCATTTPCHISIYRHTPLPFTMYSSSGTGRSTPRLIHLPTKKSPPPLQLHLLARGCTCQPILPCTFASILITIPPQTVPSRPPKSKNERLFAQNPHPHPPSNLYPVSLFAVTLFSNLFPRPFLPLALFCPYYWHCCIHLPPSTPSLRLFRILLWVLYHYALRRPVFLHVFRHSVPVPSPTTASQYSSKQAFNSREFFFFRSLFDIASYYQLFNRVEPLECGPCLPTR